ncbi:MULTISPECIES: MaoC/PaaZ C-terminal domain-containing protein [unclassified Rathayibacter]|uniref:MaoC/PaaZ C-terminal domain-containing protein n=1 Tax=unclassified Rathayibacter TaxID=2609250 RepID=UPI001AADEBB6|nr:MULTISPECIES: MaoC/PaaZ C-terminal domain-containing protein [unclassified Rathayibacter]
MTVTEEEIVSFATAFDPHTMHTDPEAARLGEFGGVIASGWHTTAIMMRLLVDHFLNERASVASPGVDELRFSRPGVRTSEMCHTLWHLHCGPRPSPHRPAR